MGEQVEFIDLVDENDQVIDTVPRSKEAMDKHAVRWVTVFILSQDKKLVIQQRKESKSYKPLRFDASVGGTVSAGDGYDESAQRELEEELGITTDLEYLGKYTATEEGRVVAHSSVHIGYSDGPFKNWEVEAERLEFFEFSELEKMVERFPYLFSNGIIFSIPLLKDFFNKA